MASVTEFPTLLVVFSFLFSVLYIKSASVWPSIVSYSVNSCNSVLSMLSIGVSMLKSRSKLLLLLFVFEVSVGGLVTVEVALTFGAILITFDS